jgi:predicted flap endonuclease-1-like 5' DNA nuclease
MLRRRPTWAARSETRGGEERTFGCAAGAGVRSEAYQSAAQGPQGLPRIGAGRGLRTAPAEDLKRIRGIGVLIEKKLNQMGIVAYAQIANWTAEEIDRVSQSLDSKGRIERENWVEQARILASGGTTEFSRRVDRGEVETPATGPPRLPRRLARHPCRPTQQTVRAPARPVGRSRPS